MKNNKKSNLNFMAIHGALHHQILKKFTYEDQDRFRLTCKYSRNLSEMNSYLQFPLEAGEIFTDRMASRCYFRRNLKLIPSIPIPNLLKITTLDLIVQGDLYESKCQRILETVRANPIRAERLEFDATVCGLPLIQELIEEIQCRDLHFGYVMDDEPLAWTGLEEEMDMRIFDLDVVRNMPKLVVAGSLELTDAQFLALHCRHLELACCPDISTDAIIRFIQGWKENQREITFCKVTSPSGMEDDEDWAARLGLIGEDGNWHLERNDERCLQVRINRLRNDNWRIKMFTEETREELVDYSDDDE